MAKPFSLQALLHLAQQQNETAVSNFGKLNQQHQAALNKLSTLQQFRVDYQLKLQEAEANGMTLTDLRNFQDFIYRLDMAIRQQEGVIEVARHSVEAGRLELSEARRKMYSFETLAKRHFEAERLREAKAEQILQDEHAGRFAAYRTAEHYDNETEGVNHE